ncbi:MAG: hypothetical protein M1835_000973 [Candelina submexicana]|nr:MAG: hypothetical protein M1835_000973 [Candelina submexicana]
MKVLLISATGNVGSRALPALLAHKHTVVVFVRSESKLREVIPSSILSQVTVATGNATDSRAVRDALVNNRCDALLNCAGQGSMFPWQAPRLQGIINGVADGAVDASKELGYPIRAWFLGGATVLDVPVFTEHAISFDTLKAKPLENIKWSMLCPAHMVPANKEIAPLSKPSGNPLIASIDIPANFSRFFFSGIPFFGPFCTVLLNAGKYGTTLEDNADFLAADLTNPDSEYVGHRVGVYDTGKKKGE